MATISNTPRPGYVWDVTDNVWYPIGVGGHSHSEIASTIADAKGDLIAGTAADTVARLAVGTNNHTLIADSAEATGLKYAAGSKATLTTTGDILYASGANTPTRLGIGSSAQVLTVASGIPSWATPASGSYTLINRTTFSTVASVTIASVFTTTYKTYVVNIEHCHGETTSTQDLGFRLRYATTDQATNCYSSAVYFTNGTSATVTNVGGANTSYFNLNNTLGSQDFAGSAATFTLQNVGQADEYALYYGQGSDYNSDTTYVYGGRAGTARTYTGITFLPDAGNITGQISIYGLATA